MTGSIPTENSPKRPSEKATIPHRVLVRKATEKDYDKPSTSTAFVHPDEVETLAGQQISIDDIKEYIAKESLEPWKSNVKDNKVSLHLYDTVHSTPKYLVNRTLTNRYSTQINNETKKTLFKLLLII